jgi:hypothetical protein
MPKKTTIPPSGNNENSEESIDNENNEELIVMVPAEFKENVMPLEEWAAFEKELSPEIVGGFVHVAKDRRLFYDTLSGWRTAASSWANETA